MRVYTPLSTIYDRTSGESALETAISEMGSALEEVEGMLGIIPLKKVCQFLVGAPKNTYTRNMLYFISTPMFFAQLDPKQIIDLGMHLFTLASEDADFESRLMPFFAMQYIYYNQDILHGNTLEYLFELTKDTGKLHAIQLSFLGVLGDYGTNVGLYLGCCEKLAKSALTDSRIDIIGKLCILQELGYFTEFTKEMRGRVIGYWKERGVRAEEEGALKILHLKDNIIELEEDLEDKILELLKKIQEEGSEDKLRMLLLEFYYHVLSYTQTDNPSGASFLDRVYGVFWRRNSFLQEIGRLLLPKRRCLIFSKILPFLPLGELRHRESIVLRSPKGSYKTVHLLAKDIAYLYSEVPFDIASGSFFNFVTRVKKSGIWTLELGAICFGLFFKEDLKDKNKATIFYNGLKRAGLYTVMPFFMQYFTNIPRYEACIAKKMHKILRLISLAGHETFAQQILCALCDNNSKKVDIALCEHFSEFLRGVLRVTSCPFSSYILLQRLFAKDAFSKHIKPAQIKDMIIAFTTQDGPAEPQLERYMGIFFSCVNDHVKTKTVTIMNGLASRECWETCGSDKAKIKALLGKMEKMGSSAP